MDSVTRTLMIRPVLAGLASLALALLWAPTSTLAQGDTLCVGEGGDYTTIQAAVDAAQAGDTIRIAGGDYTESLVITKTLTLSGGWLADCSAEGDDGTGITADAGRLLTIDPQWSGVKVVLNDVALMQGNATGLGGAESLTLQPGAAADLPTGGYAAAVDVRLAATSLQSRLTQGELSIDAEIAHRLTALLTPAHVQTVARSASAPQPRKGAANVDCGGAIYVRGAAIELRGVIINAAIASTTGDGYGGALCVIEPPADGALIEDSQFLFNQASITGVGIGGAVFIQGGVAGAVTVRNATFLNNLASQFGSGWGGGLAIVDAPQPLIVGDGEDAPFRYNIASAANHGHGGGILLVRAPGATVRDIFFVGNTASGGGAGQGDTGLGSVGRGGGLYVEDSDATRILDNEFDYNVAQATANILAFKGEGGGAYVLNSTQVQVSGNIFSRNTAGVNGTGTGGGLFIIAGIIMPPAEQVEITDNHFVGNWASAIDYTGSMGGGMFAFRLFNSTIATNTFTNNIASVDGDVKPGAFRPQPIQGGGLQVGGLEDTTIQHNQFVGNSGVVYGFGMGGALGAIGCQRTTVTDNTFERNLGASAVASGSGYGGAVAVTWGDQVAIHRNLFRNNSGQVSPAANEDEATSVLVLIGNDLQKPGDPMIDLTNVAVTENYLLDSGQGVAVDAAPQNFAIQVQATDQFTIANNVIAGSTLGGIVAIYATVPVTEGVAPETHGAVRNNTLVNNGKYGVWLLNKWDGETLTAVNNIIASHTYGAEGDDLYGPASPVDLRYTLFYSNTANIGLAAGEAITATGAFQGDPHFLAPLTHDYHLLPNSAAIDAGDPAGVPPAPAIDIDGALRPYGPRVDIGAYEWHGQGAFLPVIVKQ
jgi:hypothetical protein